MRIKDTAFIPSKGRPVSLCSREDIKYRESGWTYGGYLGGKMGPMKSDGFWMLGPDSLRSPDVRDIPAEAQARLNTFDAELRKLGAEKRRYLEDNFRTWPLVRKDDVPHITLAKTKAEAAAKYA